MALKDAQNEIRLPEKSASMELDWPGNTGLECRRLNLQTGQQVGNWSQCFTAAGFSGHNRSSGSSHILKRTNNRGCSSKIINTDWAHVFEAANTATTSNYGSGGGLSGSTIGIGLASISPSNNGFRPHKGQRAGDGQAYISGPVGQVNEGFMKQSTLNATSGPSVRVLPDVASARMASSPMALAAAATAASGTNSGSLTRGNHISSRLNNNNHHQMARTSRMASHSGPSGLVIGPHGFQHQVNLALKAASLWSDGGTPFSAGNLMRLGVGPIGRVTGSVGDKNSIGSGGVDRQPQQARQSNFPSRLKMPATSLELTTLSSDTCPQKPQVRDEFAEVILPPKARPMKYTPDTPQQTHPSEDDYK